MDELQELEDLSNTASKPGKSPVLTVTATGYG
jgi:hypothetical protein